MRTQPYDDMGYLYPCHGCIWHGSIWQAWEAWLGLVWAAWMVPPCMARRGISKFIDTNIIRFTQHQAHATHTYQPRKGVQKKVKAMNISNENQGLSDFRKEFAAQIEEGRQARIKGFIGQPYVYGQDDLRYHEAWLTGYFEGQD